MRTEQFIAWLVISLIIIGLFVVIPILAFGFTVYTAMFYGILGMFILVVLLISWAIGKIQD